MASATSATSSEARELSLISKVEMRIALADSDEKLQTLLQTYLTPLLLKLTSESHAVRNKVIALCQHINFRVMAPSIQLPVPALLKQFKEHKSELIRHYDLLYVQQGVNRLGTEARVEVLIPLLQGISEIGLSPSQGAIMFNLVLRLLPLLKLPPKSSEEDTQLKVRLGLSTDDTEFLSLWFSKLLLLIAAEKDEPTCPGLTPTEYTFLNKGASIKETWNPSASGGLNLIETKAAVLRFLASAAFSDSERFIPALIATADANSRIADLGDEILKRFTPDVENEQAVLHLYQLYFGGRGSNGTDGAEWAPPVRFPVQLKILNYLGKSIRATRETEKVARLIEQGPLSQAPGPSTLPPLGALIRPSDPSQLQTSKLRSQIFTFTTWVVRMGTPADLKEIAPKVVSGFKRFIEAQGWPSAHRGLKLSASELSLRGLAYESIGILIPKLNLDLAKSEDQDLGLDLIQWLFTSWSCDNSGSQIFISIEQALGSVLNAAPRRYNEDFATKMRRFLLVQTAVKIGRADPESGHDIVRSPRYAAVRFANRFLAYWDITGRWIDVVAIAAGGDRQQEIVEEGKKGLHPHLYRLLNSDKGDGRDFTTSWYSFPTLVTLNLCYFGHFDRASGPQATRIHDMPSEFVDALAPSVSFIRNIVISEAFSRAGIPVEVDEHWEHKLDALLSTNDEARSAVKQLMRNWTKDHTDLYLTHAMEGLIGRDVVGVRQIGACFVELVSLAPDDLVRTFVPKAVGLKASIFCNDQDVQELAAHAFGIVASHPSMEVDRLTSSVAEFTGIVTEWKSAIGEAALRVRGAILALAFLYSRSALRKISSERLDTQARSFIAEVVDVLQNSRDSLLRRAAQAAIGQFSMSQILKPKTFTEEEWKGIIEKLVQDAKAESEPAMMTLGQLSLVFSNTEGAGSVIEEILSKLYDLHEIRSPEIHFAVGEAMSAAAAGWNSTPLARQLDVDADLPSSNVPPSVLGNMCDKVIAGCSASKPALRRASAIWLLSLVKNCGHLQEMQSRLRRCQASFTKILGDRDELVQEAGAQGLGLVYEIGDQELKDDLVRDLVDSFTAGGSNLEGGRVTADTELFEPGALPTGEGSSVKTYKDIMNLAAEVGDPSLVYRFMSLASSNAIWTSRAAFGRLGISNIFSDSSVNGYLAKNPKIYPKLYRYRFDPNPNVQRSMNTIWQTLVKDPSAVVNEHFDKIMDDLSTSMLAGREWRVRQASCMAIADLISGRQPEKYSKYINEILTRAFKLLDDIKETVRAAALKLCQTVTNVVIRNLEAGGADSKQAAAMVGNAVPFLLSDKGLESSVEEVQGFAIATLIQLVKRCPGTLLRPYVPDILEKFLNSLSSLEPQAVNYIHLNADKYGLTGQEIDKMRLSSVRSSPMMEVIERYLVDNLDESNMAQLAVKLEGVLRSAVGLPSKVGCSRVLVIMSMKAILFRPYADRFVQLLTKYVVDRNDTVSASYSTSIGYLLRLASDERVTRTVEYAKNLYLNAEDATHRIVAAEIFQAMSKLANDRFNAFAASTLPFAFICKHDADEHVQTAFAAAWQDNVGGSRAVSLYIREIAELTLGYLDSPRWAIKHTAALAVADAVMSLDQDLDRATSELVWPIMETALAGKTWEGKEKVLKAFVRYNRQSRQLWREQKQLADKMKALTLREAKRANATYRPQGISALGEIARIRDDVDFMPDALSIVSGVVDEAVDGAADRMDVDGGNGHTSTEEDTLAACMSCLLQCLNCDANMSSAVLHGYLTQMTPLAEKTVNNGGRKVQAALFAELQGLFTRLQQWVTQRRGNNVSSDGDAATRYGELVSLTSELQDQLAGRLLYREVDLSVEAIRMARAEATVAYVQLCVSLCQDPEASGLVEFRDEQRQLMQAWWEGERSGPVRQILRQALEKGAGLKRVKKSGP